MQINSIGFQNMLSFNKLSKTQTFTSTTPIEDKTDFSPEARFKSLTKRIYNDIKTKGATKPELSLAVKKTDTDAKTLRLLSLKYKQNKTLANKNAVLVQERKMLFDELAHPEITAARHPKEIAKYKKQGHNVDDTINFLNLNGLWYSMGLPSQYIEPQKFDKEKITTLKNIYDKTDSSTLLGQKVKYSAFYCINWLNKPKTKEETDWSDNIIKDFINSDIPEIRADAAYYGTYNSAEKNLDISSIINGSASIDDTKSAIIELSDKNKKAANDITSILTSPKSSNTAKKYAIWAAGNCQNKENYKYIKQVALNKDEKDVQKREFALQSLALYLKSNEGDVKRTLKKVQDEKSFSSPLAKILLLKTEGRLHNSKEIFADKEMTDKQKSDYKKNLEKYNDFQAPINNAKKNAIINGLVYMQKALDIVVKDKTKNIVINDTQTFIRPENTGERFFTDEVFASGDFEDSALGVNCGDNTILNALDITNVNSANIAAHEFGHATHRIMKDKDFDKVAKLFERAQKENCFIDDYSKTNEFEYFAQGYSAYASPYLSHNELIRSDANTRAKLKVTDPRLFDFVEHCTKVYG